MLMIPLNTISLSMRILKILLENIYQNKTIYFTKIWFHSYFFLFHNYDVFWRL